MNKFIEISKRNLENMEVWRYPGEILKIDSEMIIVRAYFDQDEAIVHGLHMKKGDFFKEFYYFDRWFNILEIYDLIGKQLKGWYCNIATPIKFQNQVIRYMDLALDVIIFPQGDYLVLDTTEFEELELTPHQRKMSIQAFETLILGLNQKGRSVDLPF